MANEQEDAINLLKRYEEIRNAKTVDALKKAQSELETLIEKLNQATEFNQEGFRNALNKGNDTIPGMDPPLLDETREDLFWSFKQRISKSAIERQQELQFFEFAEKYKGKPISHAMLADLKSVPHEAVRQAASEHNIDLAKNPNDLKPDVLNQFLATLMDLVPKKKVDEDALKHILEATARLNKAMEEGNLQEINKSIEHGEQVYNQTAKSQEVKEPREELKKALDKAQQQQKQMLEAEQAKNAAEEEIRLAIKHLGEATAGDDNGELKNAIKHGKDIDAKHKYDKDINEPLKEELREAIANAEAELNGRLDAQQRIQAKIVELNEKSVTPKELEARIKPAEKLAAEEKNTRGIKEEQDRLAKAIDDAKQRLDDLKNKHGQAALTPTVVGTQQIKTSLGEIKSATDGLKNLASTTNPGVDDKTKKIFAHTLSKLGEQLDKQKQTTLHGTNRFDEQLVERMQRRAEKVGNKESVKNARVDSDATITAEKYQEFASSLMVKFETLAAQQIREELSEKGQKEDKYTLGQQQQHDQDKIDIYQGLTASEAGGVVRLQGKEIDLEVYHTAEQKIRVQSNHSNPALAEMQAMAEAQIQQARQTGNFNVVIKDFAHDLEGAAHFYNICMKNGLKPKFGEPDPSLLDKIKAEPGIAHLVEGPEHKPTGPKKTSGGGVGG